MSSAAPRPAPARLRDSHYRSFSGSHGTPTPARLRLAIPCARSFSPNGELAAQVEESVRPMDSTSACAAPVVSGEFDMKPQTAALRQGVEFLVATQAGCSITSAEDGESAQVEALCSMNHRCSTWDSSGRASHHGAPAQAPSGTCCFRPLCPETFARSPIVPRRPRARAGGAAQHRGRVGAGRSHPVGASASASCSRISCKSRDLRQVLVFTSTRSVPSPRLPAHRDGIVPPPSMATRVSGAPSGVPTSNRERFACWYDRCRRAGLDIEDCPSGEFELPGGCPKITFIASAPPHHRRGERRGDLAGVREEHERLDAIGEDHPAQHSEEIVPDSSPI